MPAGSLVTSVAMLRSIWTDADVVGAVYPASQAEPQIKTFESSSRWPP